MRIRHVPQTLAVVVLAGFCLAGGGCASLTVSSVAHLLDKKETIVTPDDLAIVWTTALLRQETSPATRGFGGLVTFHAADGKSSVCVDGELTIYAYEDASRDVENATPDRKYVITAEQLKKHKGKGTTGPAYSIWIPWDAVGGPRREIGLIARFDSVDGQSVMGKPTHSVLSGPDAPNDRLTIRKTIEEPVVAQSPDQHVASVANQTESSGAPARRMQTTTLSVPSR